MINSNVGPIVYRFSNTVMTYWPRIITFSTPLFNAFARRLELTVSNFPGESRVVRMSVGEDFVILVCFVLIAGGGRTDGQTEDS